MMLILRLISIKLKLDSNICDNVGTYRVDNLLDHWKNQEMNSPILSRIARDILPICSSGVLVETIFNSARDVCHYRRSRMLPKTVRDTMLVLCAERFDVQDSVQKQEEISEDDNEINDRILREILKFFQGDKEDGRSNRLSDDTVLSEVNADMFLHDNDVRMEEQSPAEQLLSDESLSLPDDTQPSHVEETENDESGRQLRSRRV